MWRKFNIKLINIIIDNNINIKKFFDILNLIYIQIFINLICKNFFILSQMYKCLI